MSQPVATIYTSPTCPSCVAAMQILDLYNISYEEIDIHNDNALREQMEFRSHGKRTVPQIFISDLHIGGYDELSRLDDNAKLDFEL